MNGEEGNNSEQAKNTRTIAVGTIARVEGEGALRVTVKDGEVRDVELRIFEPPRFFEAMLRGRAQGEAPDITSRICGICPIAYMMSACHAIEAAHGGIDAYLETVLGVDAAAREAILAHILA